MNRCSIKNGIINKAKQLLDSGLSLEDVNKAFGEDVVTTSQSNEVDYSIVSTELLLSEKADSLFKSLKKNKVKGDDFWNKIQNDLQIPKDQINILKSFNTTNRYELVTGLLSNYSYTIEINTAKDSKPEYSKPEGHAIIGNFNYVRETNFQTGEYYYTKEDRRVPYTDSSGTIIITKDEFDEAIKTRNEGNNSSHYSNMTVPGGTNYTENEIATPAITPSITGHAQFSTNNGIGWFRSDDRLVEDTKTDSIDGTITDYTGYVVNKIPSGYTIYNKNKGWLRDGVGKPLDFRTEKEATDYLNKLKNQGITNPTIIKDDKIIFGHPTIGKSYLKSKGNNNFITLDDDYATEVNTFVDANRGKETRQEYKGRKPKEYNQFMLNLFDRLKVQAKKEGKILFVSNTNILKERMKEFDKVITIPKDEFKKRFDARGSTYGFEDWKSDIDATVAKVDKSKVISTTGYLSDLLEGNPKIRRILEVQSDLFQKGRDLDELNKGRFIIRDSFTNELYGRETSKSGAEIMKADLTKTWDKAFYIETDTNERDNQFLQLLNKNNNWVTFFVKSIIQSTAKQTVAEVQQEDVEAKVRELEKSGLLKIKCD